LNDPQPFLYCALGSQWWICKKFFLGSYIHLLVQQLFLCIGITYLSLVLSDLFISNLISSSCALVFRLGQNLSNIPRSILSKQNFSLILPLSKHKALIYYLFSSDRASFLSTELRNSSRVLCPKAIDLRTELYLFFSSQQSQFQVLATLLAQGQTQGSMLQQRTNKTLTTGPFGNTCEADEVSPEVEAGVVAGLKCLQPSWTQICDHST
jgi:hypothetical protein